MNRENLRKVSYYTEDPNQGFDPDREDAPVAKIGYFHACGNTLWPNPHEEGTYYSRVVVVIEDEEGYMIEVPVERVRFIS